MIEATLSDSDLVERLRQRDPAAFQCLNERYLPSVWRFVYTRVDGDVHLAEDIVSEAMLALVRVVTEESATGINNPGGWLRAVANHKIQDHYRAAARVRHLMDDARQSQEQAQSPLRNPMNAGGDQSDPAQRHESEERRAEVRQAMDQLSDQYRTALEWKYLDKLSIREIAARWNSTEKAVESILFRARRELRARLQEKPAASDQVAASRETRPAAPLPARPITSDEDEHHEPHAERNAHPHDLASDEETAEENSCSSNDTVN